MQRRAVIATSSLILFIVCIGLTVATVIMFRQSSATISGQATTVGAHTRSDLSSHLQAVLITGTRVGSSVTTLTLVLAPSSATESVSLSGLLITVTEGNATIDYRPGNTTSVSIPQQNGTFTVAFLQEVLGHSDGAVRPGELISVRLELARPLARSTNVRLRILPQNGIPTVVSFTTPYAFQTEQVKLYP